MAFENEDFAVVGSAQGDAPAIYSYTTDDSLETVLSDNYFEEKKLTIVTGDIAHINTADGVNSISFSIVGNMICSATLGTGANNQVVVNTISDLPTAVAGVITLKDKTNYIIGDEVALGTNRIQLGEDNAILGFNSFAGGLTYTGTGAMFTSSTTDVTMDKLNLDCPNGTAFDFNGVGIMSLTGVVVNNAAKYAEFNDIGSLDIINCSCINATQGITATGSTNWQVFAMNGFALISSNPSFVALDFGTSVHRQVEVENFFFLVIGGGGTGISGAASSANIVSGVVGNISKGSFALATPLSGIAKSDIRWNFQSNTGVADSATIGETYLSSSQTVTINTAGVYESIDGGNWLSDIAELFTTSTAGIITYIGEQTDDFLVQGTATIEKVGGGADQLAMRIMKNSTTSAKTQSVTENSTPTSVISQGVFQLATNDTVELVVANIDSTSNVTASFSNLIVRKI